MNRLIDQIKRHEGTGPRAANGNFLPYIDSVGKVTIGYGRNLTDVGCTPQEVEAMLARDIAVAEVELRRALPVIMTNDSVEGVRRDALINMAFNMGVPRLLGFKKMLTALERGEWEEAARQGLDSAWARQVGPRATELMNQIRTGRYQQ